MNGVNRDISLDHAESYSLMLRVTLRVTSENGVTPSGRSNSGSYSQSSVVVCERRQRCESVGWVHKSLHCVSVRLLVLRGERWLL